MKYLKTYESYKITKKREEIIEESVMQVNDIYRVKTTVDVSQQLINAYVKKVKDTSGVNLRTFFGDVDLSEEIVKYINGKYLAADQIPSNALTGGPQGQSQEEVQQEDVVEETPIQEAQPVAEVQPEVQPETQVQEQPSSEEFEEPQQTEEQENDEEELPQ